MAHHGQMTVGNDDIPAKRYRRDGDDSKIDRIQPNPSVVVHVRNLSPRATEADLLVALSAFGPVAYVTCMAGRRMALVEFEELDDAQSCVNFAVSKMISVAGHHAQFNYSTIPMIQRVGLESAIPNKVLVITISNVQYPITCEVISQICGSHGDVKRIAIIRRSLLQVLVEFESVDIAKKAKHALNGADIFSGCCTLKVEFAKMDYVRVSNNDEDHHDYTRTDLSSDAHPSTHPLHQERREYDQIYDRGDADRKVHPSNAYPSRGSCGDRCARELPQPRDNYYQGGYVRGNESFSGGELCSRDDSPNHEEHGRTVDEHERAFSNKYIAARGDYGLRVNKSGARGSTVLMVYGISHQVINCDKLFNILCQYGNVQRIKFMRKKIDTAMVEMGAASQVTAALQHLQGMEMFGLQLQLRPSRQLEVRELGTPFDMPDGSPSYMDYSQSRNQRYTTPEMAVKNRICSPTATLHLFNAPPSITEESVLELFRDTGAPVPNRVVLNAGTGRSRAGTAEFNSIVKASEALALAGHTPVQSPGSRLPFVVKLAYFLPGKPRCGAKQ